mgnify:CR=1 FL=1
MSRIPLSDEETKVIFTEEAKRNLDALTADVQPPVLKQLLTLTEKTTPPSTSAYKQIGNLDIFRVDDKCRLYTKIVENIPDGNSTYHVVFLLYIDAYHEYRDQDVSTFSASAQRYADLVHSIETLDSIESFLEERGAIGAGRLRKMLDE